ncbi:acyl-CoA dehydrogenase C-terminal domain-containing protein [Paraburkholderia caribensis]|uniref:acyl-CoA dehydrogenase C-terminal domain-containing protein n=1 Tax=Paraburkholderia caribensis TaxID=75105 RepID=UPI001CB18A1A|nr:acyl-CoA dehydrogenase C-terminal domain-containing protein [Paraburkholderia caribensis]CAG9249378.1 3-methylmercaptopropionyl-CoA dehydrogenase [Paraburkholderia caribensis]
MPTYRAPISDLVFLLRDVFDYERQTTKLPGFEEVTLDVVVAILKGAGEFVQARVLPINLSGDAAGCTWENGSVTTPPGYRAAYDAYCADGWVGLAAEREHGGHGLPPSLALIVRELVASGSMSFGMYAGLTQSAYRAILAHASEAIKQIYLPKLADGTWTGTMCLTEPQSGSDLSSIRTRAQPVDDGEFQITGTKIFISSGDHDLTENIVHLVLARLPDAPSGTRGLSLFVVPKRVPIHENGVISSTVPNPVSCGSIEHKMGIRAQSTAVLNFDGARGWLIGKPNGGMRAMFTMMNSSRIGVAVQSVGVAEIAWQNALAYAKERRQGRSPMSSHSNPIGQADPIVAHPDVRKHLLTMKAYVEGMRALYVDAAMHLDIKAKHPEQAVRDTADSTLSLLTPVIKAFISDLALDVTERGIQVFGGHGYIHENGMEQFYRDARIVPLYEGTNSIQALDLVLRKLALNDGSVVELYFSQLSALLDAQRFNPRLLDLCTALEDSLNLLREATAILSRYVDENPSEAAAAASDYLRMFGLVALGATWLRIAVAADAALAQSPENVDFLTGKVKTARFYFQCLLPDVKIRHGIITAGARSVNDISEVEF